MTEHYDPAALVSAMAPLSLRAVARRLELDPANLCRPLSVNQADRYTLLLGLNPLHVWAGEWPDDWGEAVARMARTIAWHVHRHGSCRRRCIDQACSGRDRALAGVDDAIERAVLLHWITPLGPGWGPGEAIPVRNYF